MSAGPGTGTQGIIIVMDSCLIFVSAMVQFNKYATTAMYFKVFIPPSSPLTTTSQGATANHGAYCAQSQTSATAAAVSPVTINKHNHVTGSNFSPFPVDIDAIVWKIRCLLYFKSTWTWYRHHSRWTH